MKNTTLLLMLLFLQSVLLNAQSGNKKSYGKITYERVINFDATPESKNFTLLVGPDFSVFYEERSEAVEESTFKPSSDDEFDLSFEVRLNGSKYIVVTDFKKDSIQSQVSVFRDGTQKTYIVEEKINKVKWAISDELKTISGLQVQKAEGVFRGRNYIAWFTHEIPVRYGPWKLNGLPGLILNISDDRNEVMFYARSIKFPFDSNAIPISDFQFDSNHTKISLAEYIKYENQQLEEVKKLMSSKLPRGAKLEMKKIKSDVIELEYEDTIKD